MFSGLSIPSAGRVPYQPLGEVGRGAQDIRWWLIIWIFLKLQDTLCLICIFVRFINFLNFYAVPSSPEAYITVDGGGGGSYSDLVRAIFSPFIFALYGSENQSEFFFFSAYE